MSFMYLDTTIPLDLPSNCAERLLANMDKKSPSSKSPGAKSLQKKNLTGTPRHTRDLTADIHANIQRWNDLHLHGLSVFKLLIQEIQAYRHSAKLQDLCNKLEEICSGLDTVVDNLEILTKQVKITTSLHTSSEKLFKTWPISSFGEVANSIYIAYQKEARAKRAILESITHGWPESLKMLHFAAWLHQPTLPMNFSLLLESMLTETGHR